MASKPPDEPAKPVSLSRRKEPRQRRSQSTVDSIKQAALLLLKERGVRGLGTDAIAERAGVSIGSLYQYFPNRDAILASLYEDISMESSAMLKSGIPHLLNAPTEQAVKLTIDLLLSIYEKHHTVLLELKDELPHLRLTEQPFAFSVLAHSSTRAYLSHRTDTQRPVDLERKAFFLEQIILSCINGYITSKPERLTRPVFIKDLTRIITAYLDHWTPPTKDQLATGDTGKY